MQDRKRCNGVLNTREIELLIHLNIVRRVELSIPAIIFWFMPNCETSGNLQVELEISRCARLPPCQ